MGQQCKNDEHHVQGHVEEAEGELRSGQEEDDDACVDGVEEQHPGEEGAENAADVVHAPNAAGPAAAAQLATAQTQSAALARVGPSALGPLAQARPQGFDDHGWRGVALRIRHRLARQQRHIIDLHEQQTWRCDVKSRRCHPNL